MNNETIIDDEEDDNDDNDGAQTWASGWLILHLKPHRESADPL